MHLPGIAANLTDSIGPLARGFPALVIRFALRKFWPDHEQLLYRPLAFVVAFRWFCCLFVVRGGALLAQ